MIIQVYIDELSSFNADDIWIDETFDKKFAMVNEHNAFISPLPGYNTIAQLVAHLTAWRRSALSVLNGGKKTVTDAAGDWPPNEELRAKGWTKLVEEFHTAQQEMIHFLNTKDDSFLLQTAAGTGKTFDYYIRGLVHHDMYHLGQIGLVIKLVRDLEPIRTAVIKQPAH